ncbi:extracellular solute-binding protein [Paenibacillus thermoaerophilus]|uniref:Extracellular solute-binding protein n=1 Tax=Paenibacillus thermoaerophilus TaxID=1215385 RepID=A0ABW2V380_9BACL|nr:extracellular solute-binding protein [Paenibacillus thermoaerophilus]TMV17694.1 extracellular solute-binding protein [Paenibacillus thermoaerophilus]
MNNRKKTWAAAALVGTIALTSACGSDSGNNETASTGNPSSSPASQKKETITMIDFRYGALPPSDGKGLQMINEKFNVDFKPQYVVRSDYDQKLSAVIASGEIPDIIVMEAPDSNFYKWAKQGAFLPLNDLIDKYETTKLIPENVRKAVTVNGKIYAIQKYLTENYQLTPVIRKDWLDNLGLEVPKNYDELKKVALAFTKDDPDRNGKNDTYGIAMSQNINPHFGMGAYWDPEAWYHKNADGQLIPGIISEARKQHIGWLADLYKEGAITKDFALLNWAQTNKEFYSGKAGIFIGTPRGMNPTSMQGLVDVNPGAKIVPIPPFKAPDGSEGFVSSPGFYGIVMLNAKLAKEPEKVKKIMEIIDFGRKFVPLEQRNASNADFDWLNGKEGQGYKIENGNVRREVEEKGLAPINYLPDSRMWAPSDIANGYSKEYTVPLLRELAASLEKMHAETKHLVNPIHSVFSETRAMKDSELSKFLYAEQTKMIFGEKPLSDWDKMVAEWSEKGGAQIIKEVNDALKANGYTGPQWK